MKQLLILIFYLSAPLAYGVEKFGGVNSKMYEHMFELILRLKGNFLWPAMWGMLFTTTTRVMEP